MKRPRLFDTLLGAKANEQTKSRNRWMIWLSVALAVFFLYLALKNLDWISFWATLRGAQYVFLPVVLAWSSFSYLIRALRWRVLLTAEMPISRLDAFWANMSGYLGNNILPARIGELVRAAYANRAASLSLSFALASGLSERLTDVFALVLLGAISLSASGITTGMLQRAIQTMAVVAGLGAVVFLLLPGFSPLLAKIIGWIPFLNQDIKEKSLSFMEKFLLGLRALLHPRRAAAFGLYTVLIWLMDGLGIMLTGFLLHIPLTLAQAFVLLAGLGLSSAIPSTPGYVGVYQFVAVAVLGPFGVKSASALALILFMQICGWLVVGGWGLAALVRLSRNADG